MKKILKLIEELDELTGEIHTLCICGDWTGVVTQTQKQELFSFMSKKMLINRLKMEIKGCYM